MIRIAVCDDEKHFHKTMKDAITNYLEQKSIDYHIDLFDSGSELLGLGGLIVQYAVIFLDINMLEIIDGMETAIKIRCISKEICIVFVTAYIKYSLEGYKVNAIRYLLKDNRNFQRSVDECMDAVLAELNYENPIKVFQFKEGKKEILIDKVMYIESRLHTVTFHIMGNEEKRYTMAATLNEVQSILNEYSFLRIHQSFLVNMKHIASIRLYQVIMDNGNTLPVPKAKYHMVKEKFTEFKGEL